jgi:Cu/Zn superoxide dismutase
MKSIYLLPVILATFILSGCGPEEKSDPAILAVATLYSIEYDTDSTYHLTDQELGAASFSEMDGIVTLQINMTGLTPNARHAAHIHEGTCEVPGMHWNQGTDASFCRETNLDENDIWTKPKAGDIGNIRANEEGSGTFELSTKFWRLGSNDSFDITGLVVMVHQNEEDFAQECFQSHTHMHNNPKLACGTIELITND